MNRKERRLLERQGKIVKSEPVYLMKPSQMSQAITQGPGRDSMRKDVRDYLLEQDKQFCLDLDTMVLWALHTKRGYGKKRLKEFYRDMFAEHMRMRQFYQIGDTYPERHKLKEKGIDVEAWYNALFDDEGHFKAPSEVDWDAL